MSVNLPQLAIGSLRFSFVLVPVRFSSNSGDCRRAASHSTGAAWEGSELPMGDEASAVDVVDQPDPATAALVELDAAIDVLELSERAERLAETAMRQFDEMAIDVVDGVLERHPPRHSPSRLDDVADSHRLSCHFDTWADQSGFLTHSRRAVRHMESYRHEARLWCGWCAIQKQAFRSSHAPNARRISHYFDAWSGASSMAPHVERLSSHLESRRYERELSSGFDAVQLQAWRAVRTSVSARRLSHSFEAWVSAWVRTRWLARQTGDGKRLMLSRGFDAWIEMRSMRARNLSIVEDAIYHLKFGQLYPAWRGWAEACAGKRVHRLLLAAPAFLSQRTVGRAFSNWWRVARTTSPPRVKLSPKPPPKTGQKNATAEEAKPSPKKKAVAIAEAPKPSPKPPSKPPAKPPAKHATVEASTRQQKPAPEPRLHQARVERARADYATAETDFALEAKRRADSAEEAKAKASAARSLRRPAGNSPIPVRLRTPPGLDESQAPTPSTALGPLGPGRPDIVPSPPMRRAPTPPTASPTPPPTPPPSSERAAALNKRSIAYRSKPTTGLRFRHVQEHVPGQQRPPVRGVSASLASPRVAPPPPKQAPKEATHESEQVFMITKQVLTAYISGRGSKLPNLFQSHRAAPPKPPQQLVAV